jgi:3-oxosteroid 1-dehydrogenase
MTPSWDATVDVVVVGSGAAGLTAAATAAATGLRTLVVEKSRFWGGTTAFSGGGVWIPANPLMTAAGEGDSIDAAGTYLDDIIGDAGPASTPERRRAFLHAGPAMVEFLSRHGFRWTRAEDYPDYYPERPGGRVGRSIEGEVIDGRALGPLLQNLRRAPGATPLPVQTRDLDKLNLALRTPRGFARGAAVSARVAAARIRRRVPLAAGLSLVAQLAMIGRGHGMELWLDRPVNDLIVHGDCVIGVEIADGDRTVRVRATRGVVLAAGGFARNDTLRRTHQVVGNDWTATSRGDDGDAITLASQLGAATALMDEAWWSPTFVFPGGARTLSVWERSMPGAIIVDQTARRFVNESASYLDVGRAILERNRTMPAVPSWLVLDARHRRRYLLGTLPPVYTPRRLVDAGFLIRARSLEDLAEQTGLDRGVLRGTITRFNGFAATGVDEDFGRGDSAYDRYYGDPRVRPNPNLGPLTRPPFYAVRLYPGDLGTKGGLVTDEVGRVLRPDKSTIGGLYAAGNTTASVMGRTYPGPGGTIGPAMVFAHLAALDMAATST